MADTSENKPMKYKNNISVGLFAHVDAGKTTLSEAILYTTGRLRKLGRVDHKDAFLDNFALERERGITIFSKQARFPLGEKEAILLDTPGHVDFSAETERTLSVLDYAILVISASDGIQGHTMTLWRLMKEYKIPVFLFINKMDLHDADSKKILMQLKEQLDSNCISFMEEGSEEFMEEAAMCDEETLEEYMESGKVGIKQIVRLIRQRKMFPCYFGSALKLVGVEELLDGMERYTSAPQYPKEFGARIYKISREEKGARLSHLKVTGGTLCVKQSLPGIGKVDQIRLYSGNKYELIKEAPAGTVCAVTGLLHTYAGQGLGMEHMCVEPVLEPLLSYRLILPEDADIQKALEQIRQLEEEEPSLHVLWNSHLEEIHVQLMGEVQTEILKCILADRFGLHAEFGSGRIIYKETIQNEVLGIGHYEPLRHYAHVNLLLRPGKPGSGLRFYSECREDVLDRNWQRLILTHLQEKEHLGVLAGMPITDMEIVLHSGKAHQKHTEGGDFRQATYRAVRQGLMKADSLLLEPWYSFRLELPSENIGRAMSDVQGMSGRFDPPRMEETTSILRGEAPVSEMLDYQKEVWSYSGGKGRLTVILKGYEPCHNQKEVIEALQYEAERDLDNPADSVFCAHGSGYIVPWNEVDAKCDISYPQKESDEAAPSQASKKASCKGGEDAELLAIMEREFGKAKNKRESSRRYLGGTYEYTKDRAIKREEGRQTVLRGKGEKKKQYLLVDGYNIIFSWEELKELSDVSMDAARLKLMDILSNYQGFTGCTLILVFDAYKVEGNPGEIQKINNIYVVFTKEAETADQYIEKATHEIGKKHHVTVATSDHLEQVIVMGQGALKISASDFYEEIERVNQAIRVMNEEKRLNDKNYLFHHLDEETAEKMEEVRLGKKEFTEI